MERVFLQTRFGLFLKKIVLFCTAVKGINFCVYSCQKPPWVALARKAGFRFLTEYCNLTTNSFNPMTQIILKDTFNNMPLSASWTFFRI